MDKIAKTLIQFGHTQVFIPNALLEYEDSRLGKSNGLKDFGAFTLYDMMKINKSNNPGISFLRAKGQARTKI
jgi:hypothetical protein